MVNAPAAESPRSWSRSRGDDDPVRLHPVDDLRAVERVDHVEHLGLLGGALQGRRLHELCGERREVPEPEGRPERDGHEQARRDRVAAAPVPEPLGPADRPRADRLAVQEAPQVVGELLRGRIAAGGRLGHRLQADRLQVARDLVVELARRPRLVLEDLEDQHPPVAAERAFAGQQLVEDDARAVDIAPGVDPVRLAARLLGRHVGRRAQHLAVLGHDGLLGLALGQAEVHQVRAGPRRRAGCWRA